MKGRIFKKKKKVCCWCFSHINIQICMPNRASLYTVARCSNQRGNKKISQIEVICSKTILKSCVNLKVLNKVVCFANLKKDKLNIPSVSTIGVQLSRMTDRFTVEYHLLLFWVNIEYVSITPVMFDIWHKNISTHNIFLMIRSLWLIRRAWEPKLVHNSCANVVVTTVLPPVNLLPSLGFTVMTNKWIVAYIIAS